MSTIALVGIDLGKRTFHIHAQDAGGRAVLRRQMNRVQLVRWLVQLSPGVVAFEACCGAHWLGWKLREFGHTPRMLDPRRVRPFVTGNKHDFADAQAICEAACRPTIRSIEPKTPEQLALASLHRIRDARVAERTACINQTHAFLLEFGMSMAGSKAMMNALPDIAEDASNLLPSTSRQMLMAQYEHYQYLCMRLEELDRQIRDRLKDDELAVRLQEVPGIGPITASALCAEATPARQCASSRDFAASHWPDTPPTLDWGPLNDAGYHQARGWNPAPIAGAVRPSPADAQGPARGRDDPVGAAFEWPSPHQRRSLRPGAQTRAHPVGHPGARPALSAPPRGGSDQLI